MKKVNIRTAVPEDTPLIYDFIMKLAQYEKKENEVKATPELLYESLFVRHQAEVLIAMNDEQPVGFALYFHNFSTFLGKANLYLEDLYVDEAYRHQGIGSQLFKRLAEIAVERNCERLDWWCLDWNASAIKFYTQKLHAEPMHEWTVYRLCDKGLMQLAKEPLL